MARESRAGFSLCELLLALGLVAILAAIAIPPVSRLSAPFRVQAAGREVYAALQEVRQQAILRGQRTRFQLAGTGRYTLAWDSAGTWVTIRGPAELERNVVLTSTGGDPIFQPRGTVSPFSTVTIVDAADPGHRMVISIPITGLVRMRRGGG